MTCLHLSCFFGPENPSLQTREEPRVLKVRHALVHQWQALRKMGEGTHGHKKESPLLHGASGNGWYKESGLKCLLMACNAKPHKSLSAASLCEAELIVLNVTFMAEPLCLCQSRYNVGSRIGFAVKGSVKSGCFFAFSSRSLSACLPFLKYYMVKYHLYSLNVIMKSKLTLFAFLIKVPGLIVNCSSLYIIAILIKLLWSCRNMT